MRIYWVIILLFCLSCSSNRIEKKDALELQEMTYMIQLENTENITQIKEQLIQIQQILEEYGWEKDSTNDLQIARNYVEKSISIQHYYKTWKDSLIAANGGLDQDHELLANWDKDVNMESSRPLGPDFNSSDPLHHELNIMFALLELTNREFTALKILKDEIMEFGTRKYNLNKHAPVKIEITETISSTTNAPNYQLWSMGYLPVEKFQLNGSTEETNAGILEYSRSDWDKMNIQTIGVPLQDTVLTFYLRPN